MKIELRKFKYFASASEETLCYTASLFVNGKLTADLRNHGHGGATTIRGIDHALLSEVEAYCNTLPDVVSQGMNLKMDLEFYVDLLAGKLVAEKDLKSKLRTKIVFQKPDGEIYFANIRGQKVTDELVKQYQVSHPEYKVLNLIPFDEALEIYSQDGVQ